VKIYFACPSCERPARLDLPGPAEWKCPCCEHSLALEEPGETGLPRCAVCGTAALYRKKDFPHWLGLSILTGACLLFLALMGTYHQWLAWAVLIGSAVFDGALYLWVRDVIVCYRCGAHFRGVSPGPEHKPFELGIAERYRQERIRREQLEADRKPAR
jgi:hypothetical protein